MKQKTCKNPNNATNQKPTCCASLFRSRKTRFDLWYGSCAVFFSSWQLSCRLVDPGIPCKDGMLPRCQQIHPWRPDSIGKTSKILKPLRKNKFIWKPFKNSDGETAYITKNNEWLHVYQQLASKCAGNSGLNITNLNQRPFPGQI